VSELLRRIDERLAVAGDPQVRGVLQAQRACYLARVGDFDAARAAVAALRAEPKYPGHEVTAIWVMLVEGVLDYFENLGSRARDRIRRAHLLSLSLKHPPLVAISSAWRTHLEFEFSDFSAMADALGHFYSDSSQRDDESIGRTSLTLASALAVIGRAKEAKAVSEIARTRALAMGDQATIEAVLHNRASIGVATSRIRRALGELTDADIAMNRMELASARNFQTLIRVRSLNTLTELCEARLAALEGQHALARQRFAALLGRGPFPAGSFSEGVVALEIAHCTLCDGEPEAARRVAAEVSAAALDGLDPDDRMVAGWLDLELARGGAGRLPLAAAQAAFDDSRDAFLRFRDALAAAVDPYVERALS
jgi:hypothetical protein